GREPIGGQLHAISRVSSETDDDPVELHGVGPGRSGRRGGHDWDHQNSWDRYRAASTWLLPASYVAGTGARRRLGQRDLIRRRPGGSGGATGLGEGRRRAVRSGQGGDDATGREVGRPGLHLVRRAERRGADLT